MTSTTYRTMRIVSYTLQCAKVTTLFTLFSRPLKNMDTTLGKWDIPMSYQTAVILLLGSLCHTFFV